MAMIAGIRMDVGSERCNLHILSDNEDCPFIWRDFERSGYATASAEDEQYMGTFCYSRVGFKDPPTTHYFRPFGLGAESHLTINSKFDMKFCLGYQNYADYIYQSALDLAKAYKNDSFFGLFWTNTFSHSDVSGASSMDDRMKYYLEQLDEQGTLNNSAVFFFSDHGIRYGPFRESLLVNKKSLSKANFINLFDFRLAGSKNVCHLCSSRCHNGLKTNILNL